MKSGISLDEIKSPDDALEMAACRNQVRTFMTHNQEEITPDAQLDWYRDTYGPARYNEELYGYVVRDGSDAVGYGLISKREEKWWLSGGILADQRGKGLGKFLFQTMTDTVHGGLQSDEAWLDVLRSNDRAQSLYISLGYRAVRSTADLIVMVHTIYDEKEAA